MKIEFRIPIEPRTKKNHLQIHKSLKNGKSFPAQSKQYRRYVADTALLLNTVKTKNKIRTALRGPVHLKAIFYMGTRRIVDLNNLLQCLTDVLVHAMILEDDSCRVIVSTDGSRVRYDKMNPRTEVVIEDVTDESEVKEWELMFP